MNPVALGIGIGLFASSLFMVIFAHRNFKIGTSYEEVFGRRIKLMSTKSLETLLQEFLKHLRESKKRVPLDKKDLENGIRLIIRADRSSAPLATQLTSLLVHFDRNDISQVFKGSATYYTLTIYEDGVEILRIDANSKGSYDDPSNRKNYSFYCILKNYFEDAHAIYCHTREPAKVLEGILRTFKK